MITYCFNNEFNNDHSKRFVCHYPTKEFPTEMALCRLFELLYELVLCRVSRNCVFVQRGIRAVKL